MTYLIWVNIDKSVFNVDTDVFLCLAYNVPTGSTREVHLITNYYY